MLNRHLSEHWIKYFLAACLLVMLTGVVSRVGLFDNALFFLCVSFALVSGALLGKSNFPPIF